MEAARGRKARNCPRLEARLAALEQHGVPVDAPRRRRLTERVANRCVALDEIQVLGTSNSYHWKPRPALLSLLIALDPGFRALDYEHTDIHLQLSNQGVRQLELDVFADPEGGLYDLRRGLILIGDDPDGPAPDLQAAGFKVLNIQDIDFESQCVPLHECLIAMRIWSDLHPGHLPVVVLIQARDEPVGDPFSSLGFTVPVPIGTAELDDLDETIRTFVPRRKLVIPDDVRRGRPTLEEAVLTLGWPRLGALRGKFLFFLANADKRDAYRAGRPALQKRVMFTNSRPGEPDAAFVMVDDPLDPSIPALVAGGYLVRTRADADTIEARAGDTARRDAALASGAHFVSTDYPVPDRRFGTGYLVQIPGGTPARCNPLTASAGCREAGLERLRRPRPGQ